MKISLDQAITATGACAWVGEEHKFRTFYPKGGHRGWAKQHDVCTQIIEWFDEMEHFFPDDPITDVSLEEFIKFVPRDRVGSMMLLNEFSGYLRRAIVDWAWGRDPFYIWPTGKGNITKQDTATYARGLGYRDLTEHEADALYLGALAGFQDDRRSYGPF